MRIVVTGNMGAGKSTFLAWLRTKLPKTPQVSMDELVANLYQDKSFKAWLQDNFGVQEKAQVAEHVARHPDALNTLMGHTYGELFSRLEACMARGENRWDEGSESWRRQAVVAEVPLLFESSMGLWKSDLIVTLDVPEETRLARVLARDKRSEVAVRAKMASQLSDATKRSLADIVIDGTKSFDDQSAAQLLVLAVRVTELFGKPTWDLIQQAYAEPHRGYHGLGHLAHLFEEFEKVKQYVHEPKRFAVALLFHDFVYETHPGKYGQNESESAKAMLAWARSTAPSMFNSAGRGQGSRLAGAAELILATKSHSLESSFIQSRPELKADAELFLDLDLSQLSRDRVEDALADQAGIWHEFSPYVPISMFCEKRIEVLESFKTRERLYFSEHYALRRELAIRNLNAMQEDLRMTAKENEPRILTNRQGS